MRSEPAPASNECGSASILCHSGRRASVSCLLRDTFHWLRVPERVEYKICLLVFKALHGMAPNYLSELCRRNAEDTARSRLRSAARGDLKFLASRRTSEAMHSLSPGRCYGTDFLQKSGQTTRCRVSSLSLRHTISDSNHL